MSQMGGKITAWMQSNITAKNESFMSFRQNGSETEADRSSEEKLRNLLRGSKI